MDRTTEIEILFTAMLVFTFLGTAYLIIRERRILAFDRRCKKTILDKPTFPWPDIHGITEQLYLDRELEKYELAKPAYRDMLFSLRKLTIENWFSLYDQKYLFGLPVSFQDLPTENGDDCRQIRVNKPKQQ